jgi:acylphosphatase
MVVKITIHGRVQGVFFRAFVKETAERLGIKGYVRNTDDSVEIIAEGGEEAINELIKECKMGPAGSLVKYISSENVENKGYRRFEIVY